MAEIQENNNKEKKGSKQKKMNIRVDKNFSMPISEPKPDSVTT